jgi:DNA gyrase subunit A
MEATARIIQIKIEDEMKSAFIDYSMSVIISRALPDVRDGLKPVHRRILYAMHDLKNFYNKPYLKSARIVGEVIGRFHPHGDSSVYDALVRMAQSFSMRYPIVQGQGNFGSIDGDSPAAMRYTEVRLQEMANFLLQDIDKETVDFGPNYDDKEIEPLVMPSSLPHLLLNGSAGIAVGMATNIPPHNLTEILDGILALIENPEITIDELMQYVKGPDFPTAASIMGAAGIRSAFHTGRGSVVMRAITDIEEGKNGKERIVVKELPYQVNKARLLERIAELVKEGKVEGITDLRDESAQEDIRVVIEVKKGESPEIILNNLYKTTPLQTSFGVNMVSLVKGVPRLLNIKDMLLYFYEHRREVILRRTAFELRKAEDRGHILLGLKTAVENLDSVVAIIRGSADSQEAQVKLIENYELTEIQAKAILEMRLSRLTGLEREKIVSEYEELIKLIKELRDILSSPSRVTEIIIEEFSLIREKFGDERRTILLGAANDFTMESLVADEEVAVAVTHHGYIKRTPLADIRAQRRGGKGRRGMKTREEDLVSEIFITTNHQSLLCFTNQGRVHEMKVYQVPETELAGKGRHFASLVKLTKDERVISVLPIREFSEGHFIVSVTQKGYIKKTDLMAYSHIRQNGLIALKLDDGDSLVSCNVTNGENELILATRLGKAIRFSEKDIRPMGRSARGVTGIRFSESDDLLIGMTVVKDNGQILSISENGYGKRTPLGDYRDQTRGGKGVYTLKVTDKTGPVVGVLQVDDSDHLMVMTSSGKVSRFTVNEIGVIGRLTQGVKLISLEDSEKVQGFARIPVLEGEEV